MYMYVLCVVYVCVCKGPQRPKKVLDPLEM